MESAGEDVAEIVSGCRGVVLITVPLTHVIGEGVAETVPGSCEVVLFV